MIISYIKAEYHNKDCAEPRVDAEHEEVSVIVMTDTVVKPRTVMVHLENASDDVKRESFLANGCSKNHTIGYTCCRPSSDEFARVSVTYTSCRTRPLREWQSSAIRYYQYISIKCK